MVGKYELVDKFKIVDPFKPEVTLAVVLDPSLAKEFLKAINTQHKEDKTDKSLRESLRVAKLSISKKDAKIARLEALLAEAGIQTRSTSSKPKKDPNEPRKKPSFKPKKCAKCDTMFIPKSGRSYLCDSCNLAHKQEVARRPRGSKTPPVLRTELRGSGCGSGRVSIPTVDQVMAMTDIEEKTKWQSRWSPAEWAEAKKIENKMMMDKMRKMRNRGFSLDDPIMGVNASTIGYKK